MAENSRIFLQLTSPSSGKIKGECSVDEYEDWIELDSWNWSLGRAKNEDATPEPSLLSFSKLMDRSTTAMLKAMLSGEQLRAKLAVDDGSVDVLFELTVMLEHVTVREYTFNTQVGEKGATVDEEWVLDYRWITFEYQADAKSGVKSVKLHRPLDASTDIVSDNKRSELKKVGMELLAQGISQTDLKTLWEEMVQAHEAEKNKPDGKSPSQSSKTPEEK